MKSAIVAGGFGRLGTELVKLLVAEGVQTLCIGRLAPLRDGAFQIEIVGDLLTHVRLSVDTLRRFGETKHQIPWTPAGECVFFNLAWGRSGQLAVPDVPQQISSASLVSDFVNVADAYKCVRFVQAGSQQERFAEDFLVEDWKAAPYPTSQGIYAAAKLISRDLGSILCYLKRIDFVNMRFCSYISDDLTGTGYIPSSLRAIRDGRDYPRPVSALWTEIIPIVELSRAFVLAGAKGRNKADYYVGTRRPRTLAEYLGYFELARGLAGSPETAWTSGPLEPRDQRHFDPGPLRYDVGFELADTFEAFTKRVVRA